MTAVKLVKAKMKLASLTRSLSNSEVPNDVETKADWSCDKASGLSTVVLGSSNICGSSCRFHLSACLWPVT